MYCLPKEHISKQIEEAIKEYQSDIITIIYPLDLTMRPIVAGPVCPTHRLSHLLDIDLRPLVSEVTENLMDTVYLVGPSHGEASSRWMDPLANRGRPKFLTPTLRDPPATRTPGVQCTGH